MDECVNFIVNECNAAADSLELQPWRDNTALGHATKGAALALKSRVLLYAASPLYLDYENLDETHQPMPQSGNKLLRLPKRLLT